MGKSIRWKRVTFPCLCFYHLFSLFNSRLLSPGHLSVLWLRVYEMEIKDKEMMGEDTRERTSCLSDPSICIFNFLSPPFSFPEFPEDIMCLLCREWLTGTVRPNGKTQLMLGWNGWTRKSFFPSLRLLGESLPTSWWREETGGLVTSFSFSFHFYSVRSQSIILSGLLVSLLYESLFPVSYSCLSFHLLPSSSRPCPFGCRS